MTSRAGSWDASIGMENHQSQTRSIMFSGTSPQPTDSSNASPDEDQKVDQVLRQSCQSSFQIYYSPSLPETHDLDIQDKALIATAAIEQSYSGMSLQSSVFDDESLRVKANERVVFLLTVCTEAEDLSEINDSTTPAPPATLLTPLEQLIQLAPVRYLPSSPFLCTLAAPGFNFEFSRRNFDIMQGAATRFLSEQDRFNNTMQQQNQEIRVLRAPESSAPATSCRPCQSTKPGQSESLASESASTNSAQMQRTRKLCRKASQPGP